MEPLATFMDYITYEFMIDNVMLLLKVTNPPTHPPTHPPTYSSTQPTHPPTPTKQGTLSGRTANELIKQCHPLGLFKESTMRSIPTFEASPKVNNPPTHPPTIPPKPIKSSTSFKPSHVPLLYPPTHPPTHHTPPQGYADLYQTALIDTPVGPYLSQHLIHPPTHPTPPQGYADLYQTVLIDTPVGPYLSQHLIQPTTHPPHSSTGLRRPLPNGAD